MDLNSTHSGDTRQKVLKNVKGLMLCRIIILTLLLAITFLFQLSEKRYFFIPMTNHFYYYVILFYWVTILYALLLRTVQNYHRFAMIQIVVDHVFITGLIYFTGGKESFFPVAYIFSIIGSSLLFYKRGAFFFASLATVLYGLLLLLQLYQWIHPLGHASPYEASQIFYTLIISMAAFYIVAFLSSAISEELKNKKKELIQKQTDYNQLEAFNRNIIQSLDSGLLTMEPSGKINFLNRTAEKILNLSMERLENRTIHDLFPNFTGMIEETEKKSLSLPPDFRRYETEFVNSKGNKIHLGFSLSPLTDPNGALIGHTLIFQDITSFKQMEEQMKRFDKMAAVGLLAAGMAHEIRNPLASLSGSIQMLQSELVLDSHQQNLMNITLRESERLNALITDFLLFAQPPQTHKVSLDILKVVEETLELFTHSPSFHEQIRLHRQAPPERIQVVADPDQMRQVFWNLLINAAQAIPGGGDISVHLEKGNGLLREKIHHLPAQYRRGNWVKVSISDTGGGILPEDRDKIFEPFFTTKENGTGLGLSIVHKIIETHHGVIKVESGPGKGSTFTIVLPAE